MKIAVISDAHGNAPALRSCFRFLRSQEVQQVFHLGDAFGYLPFYSDVLELLAKNGVVCLKGNHDAMVLGELEIKRSSDRLYRISKIKKTLTRAQLQAVRTWPAKLELTISGGEVLMLHGSPCEPLTGYIYPDSDLNLFSDVPADIVFMGNTHHPFIRYQDRKIFINVGSVGLPRDVGNLSSVCIFDANNREASIYRVPFEPTELMEDPNCKGVHKAVWSCMGRRKADFVGALVS